MPPKGNKNSSPRSACGDQWGILGLQNVVNQPENADGKPASPTSAAAAPAGQDSNMLLLTRGFDLANLGLQLVTTETLHSTFANPWVDAPSKVQPDFKLPSCYTVSSPNLHYSMFQKFQLETLFYVFYSMPKDVLQLAASQELYAREWRFHRQLGMWLTRFPNTEPTIKHQQYEKGSYLVFNPTTWTKERKDDFFLQYEQLDEKSSQIGFGNTNGAAAAAGAGAAAATVAPAAGNAPATTAPQRPAAGQGTAPGQ